MFNKRRKNGKDKGQIEVTCLIASEIDTSADCDPVVWWLLTNREDTTLEQTCGLIDWYRTR